MSQVGREGEPPANPLLAPLTAFQFLTVLPPIIRRAFTPQELGQATGFFPLVGLALGGLLIGADWLLGRVFPPQVTAALLLAVWTGASGGLHMDGFLDACDGLLGGFTPEDRLRILKDERKGAFAVTGGILLMLVKYAALLACLGRPAALLLAPTLGRGAMTMAIYAFPYARPSGLGKAMKDQTTWVQAALAVVLAGGAAIGVGRLPGAAALGRAAAAAWGAARFTLARIPGLTGDIYGAINEIVETAVLVIMTANFL
jgi:adenosylcobinamide-GDP ribazoletransferase